MDNILKELFLAFDPTPPSKEEAAAADRFDRLCKALMPRVTYEEVCALEDAHLRVHAASDVEVFSCGFRLGVRLTLAALQPAGQ